MNRMLDKLVKAADEGNTVEINRLLGSGVPINGFHFSWGLTPLMAASREGHEDAVRLLLSRGANANLVDNAGWTALHHASSWNKPSIVDILLKSGADHSLPTKDGSTALHVACGTDCVSAVEMLVRHGANPACRNQAGNTPVESCKDAAKRAQIQTVINSFSVSPGKGSLPAPAPSPASSPAPAPAPAPAASSAPAPASAEQLRSQVTSLTSERNALQRQLNERTREKDGIVVQLSQVTTERNTANSQRDAAVADRNVINTQLTACTTERDQLRTERDNAVADRNAINSQLTARNAELASRTRERDTIAAERDAAVAALAERTRERDAARAERDQLRAQGTTTAGPTYADSCPFVRYQPHVYAPGVLPAESINTPGLVELPRTSSLFTFAHQLTLTGGAWWGVQRQIAGFRLARVHAVVPTGYLVAEYTARQARMNALRATGGAHFNQSDLNAEQLRILNTLRNMFHERAPGISSSDRTVNTVYCYHGPRRENLESICSNGMVAVGGMDAGFFGVGCYTTLNIEYAARYAYGDFDTDASGYPTGPRTSGDGLYPIIMFAATVGMAYPITREVDYTPGEQHSQLLGRPFKRGFDAHVACVNQMTGYQAVARDQCEYVELVFEQQAQLLPLAVLWFEKI